MLDADGRVAMVSGAARGIGRAVVLKLLASGFTVSAGVRDRHDLPASNRLLTHRYDAEDPGSADAWAAATIDRFGRVDAVVAAAGINPVARLLDRDDTALDALWTVNVKGPKHLVRAAWPHLVATGNGRVAILSSLSGKRVANENMGYAASKFAAVALTHAIRREGWEAGIRANARGAWLSVAGFWTDYEDFIVSLVPLGPDPETGTLLFQSQNVARARIRGVEFESGLPLGLLSPRLDAFGAGLSGYWARGEDRRGGGSLDDVGPASALAFVDWASASGHWSWRLSTLVARGKVRGDDAAAWFRVPGHGVVDLVAAWRAGDRLTVRAGVFNLGVDLGRLDCKQMHEKSLFEGEMS